MARFRIEGSEIDVAALEARVDAAIEAKRGTRFTDEDLERLRSTPLEPRLRREDLPRGLLGELSAVRGHLAEVPPVPETRPAAPPTRPRTEAPGSQRQPPLAVAPPSGVAGKVMGRLRRLLRLPRTLGNLEGMLVQQQDYAREMVATTERELVAVEQRLERSFDVLKDNLDDRIDRTAEWTGTHQARTSGIVDERQERSLHLAHNMVVELTNARLDLQQMQARLNEMARRMTELEIRGRTLEKLTLSDDS